MNAVYIDKVEASQNVVRLVSMIGKTIPLFSSGVGKALLADMSDEKIKSIWEQSDIHKLTEYTITDFNKFMHSLIHLTFRNNIQNIINYLKR